MRIRKCSYILYLLLLVLGYIGGEKSSVHLQNVYGRGSSLTFGRTGVRT